jgi:SAM-dependent methyltransferase
MSPPAPARRPVGGETVTVTLPLPLGGVLVCPVCGDALSPGTAEMRCGAGHRWPVHGGYLDTTADGWVADAASVATAESFGYEWTTFDDVRSEDEEFAEVYFRDLDLGSLEGKLALDAGCGKGRYTRFLAPHAAALVALDGSLAVEAAVRNLGTFPNVAVVRSDLRRTPIRAGSMDFVSCLGVLHHLDDPRQGFRDLRRLLAPGGTMLVYLYSRPSSRDLRHLALSASALLRRATVRMPHRLLRAVSVVVAAGLFVGVVGAGRLGERLGWRRLADLPMAGYRGKPFRSLELDTFDRLSAPVEHRYTWEELEPWFDEAGLEVLSAREQAGWFVVAKDPGVRPAGGQEPASANGSVA